MRPLKTFIIYARKDESFKNDLLLHLRGSLIETGHLEVWQDGEILPGEDWEKKIEQQLEAAELFLVLLSIHSLTSEFIRKKELVKALKQKSRIVPILVRSCFWQKNPVFAGLQGLPKNMKPVASFADHDDAWTEVMVALHHLVETIWKEEKEIDKGAESSRVLDNASMYPESRVTFKVPLKTLIFYAHQDIPVAAKLERFLDPLVHKGMITLLQGGSIGFLEPLQVISIKPAIHSADLILLLLSDALLALNYFKKGRFKELLVLEEQGKAIVVPVLVQQCNWEKHSELQDLFFLPPSRAAILSKHWSSPEKAIAMVVDSLVQLLERRLGEKLP